MKSKKYATIFSLLLTLFSLIIYTIFNFFLIFQEKLMDYLIVIISGVFTGALLTFIISFAEYFSEKKIALIRYFNLITQFTNQLSGLSYLFIENPVAVKKCLKELKSNKLSKDIQNYNEEEKLKSIIKNDLNPQLSLKINLDNLVEERFPFYIKKIENQILLVMNQYIYIKNLSFLEIENAFGELDFMISKYKKKVLYPIYLKIKNLHDHIIEKSIHFENYNKYSYKNNDLMIDHIFNIQENLFSTKDCNSYINVFNDFYSKISKEIKLQRNKLFNDIGLTTIKKEEIYVIPKYETLLNNDYKSEIY